MSQRIRIRGGRVIDPASGLDEVTDVWVGGGRLLAIGPEPPPGFAADFEIDAHRRLVLPGLVDLAARLREPGEEHKATIASETRAAVAGGITTLCCPPDTQPPIDTPAVVELIRKRADAAGYARVEVLGALTRDLAGETLTEMAALKEEGCVGVSNAGRPLASSLVLRRALEYAATYELTVFIQPEDAALAADGCVHEGETATRLGLPGIPAAAETAAVAHALALIEHTGARAHFCRLSHTRSVQMIARARYDGLPVTADVAAPYLFLTDHDVGDFDPFCHVRPPLRTDADRDALRRALANGAIDALCSDHQPHEPDAKRNPFPMTEPGISGLDTLLSLGLRLVEEGVLDLPTLVMRLCTAPGRILGLEAIGTGRLLPGRRADLVLVDPDAVWRVTPEQLLSAGHNTPFMGWELRGRVTHTLVGGRVVFERRPERL
ncbi:MAG: dihydroorotase [Gammaproteobacteria bacterium]|nr:MAG: dihydroorotase [Gammaproteobacteria bacterium]